MAVTWITPAGNLGIITERVVVNIPLEISSDGTSAEFTVIAGSLPRGLRISTKIEKNNNIFKTYISGSPTEVRIFTESRFVIRATSKDAQEKVLDIEDRTFLLSVDGSDAPQWVTKEGFLNVGEGENYFVLDNAKVDFQLEAYDSDVIAGDKLEYYLIPSGGELPPGLSLTRDGKIIGYTDPVFAIDIDSLGGYDTTAFDITYFDKPERKSNGYDSFFYDITTFDYNEPSQTPRRLSRFYTFIVAVSDGANEVKRLFRIWVVTEDFLKSDNSLVQVDTNIFRADNTGNRIPIWITPNYLGTYRANNYLTIYLDVYDPPSLSGTIAYVLLPNNPDGSKSELPPGMTLDTITGEIAGRVPYQARITKRYTFTMQALDFPATLANINYTLEGDWSNTIRYTVNQAVRYDGIIYICLIENTNQLPNAVDSIYWSKTVASADKTFYVDIIGEIDSAIEWLSDSFLGYISPNQPSILAIKARSLILPPSSVTFRITSGILPPGLELLGTGEIIGKVKQFGDSGGPGLTRFYYKTDDNPSEDESTLSKNYNILWDGGDPFFGNTSFDKTFTFTVLAEDNSRLSQLSKTFSITVIADNTKTFANLYLKPFQKKNKRIEWFDFITNNEIFKSEELYRFGDSNFSIQSEIKVLLYAGIESREAVRFIQAISRNHYRKQLKFGGLEYAVAKDSLTQEPIYEAVYVKIVDDLEKNGKSISSEIQLPENINSKVLISYDAIKVDSNIPLVSDRDHQRIFPNSIKNMRNRLKQVGDRDRTFLPLWMRSIQDKDFVESGYVSALVLCYTKPGFAQKVISRIKAKTQAATRGDWSPINSYLVGDTVKYEGSYYTAKLNQPAGNPKIPNEEKDFWVRNFDFKSIDFTADRYIIDILDGEVSDKYLAFPQRGEKLP